jgi:hypothetical protein
VGMEASVLIVPPSCQIAADFALVSWFALYPESCREQGLRQE